LLTIEQVTKEEVANQEKWQDDMWMLDKGLKAFYVIDGQQRLTTVIILIDCILENYGETDGVNLEAKTDWVKKFLWQQFGKYKSYNFGYEKDNPSDEFFRTRILDQESATADKVPERTLYTANLSFAKKYFRDKLKALNGGKTSWEDIFRKVTTSLLFNVYEIDNDLDVFVTFETMNNRGRPLSKLELLKNRLIYLSTKLQEPESDRSGLRRDVNEAWKTVYAYLGKNPNDDETLTDDEFLYNHWVMTFEYERGESEAYARFLLNEYFTVPQVLATKIGFDEIKSYVDSLAQSVKEWYYIFNPNDSPYSPDVKAWLDRLNRLRFASFYPLVLAALVKGVEEKTLVKLMESIERFIFLVFHVSARQSNTKNNHFFRVASRLFKDEMTIEEVIENLTDLTDGSNAWVDVGRFKDQIADLFKKSEGFYSWGGIRYLLYEYESHLQDKAKGEEKIGWREFSRRNKEESIEHIFPREAKLDCWKDTFGEYSKKEKEILLHSLGNLLILSQSKNSELQNKCFDFKRKHVDKRGNSVGYFNGSYSEIEVSENSDWTPRDIVARGVSLLSFIEKRWTISFGQGKDKQDILRLDFVK
jgi:uncharacterized protein with ParB-like and HNH nuclease domain